MKRGMIWQYTKIIGGILILILILRYAFVEAYKIPSCSMVPTLLIGDSVFASKFIYGLKIPFFGRRFLVLMNPKRGDVIVFRSPEDSSMDLIKRVVGVEGDLIGERDKQIFINGKPINEPYVQHTDNILSDPRDNFDTFVVPKGKIFVMGDNRDESYDSRFFGFVDIWNIEGKVLILYWSWDSQRNLPRFGRIGHLLK